MRNIITIIIAAKSYALSLAIGMSDRHLHHGVVGAEYRADEGGRWRCFSPAVDITGVMIQPEV